MPEPFSVAPSNLLLDTDNPRLSQPNDGQRDAMRAIVKLMPRKILRLASDIVEHGLSPSDLPFVIPAHDDENRYIVLEGNRRLVALRALETPDAFLGAFDSTALAEIKKLAREYHGNPIDTIQCVLVKSRDEADHWIRLRHTGENQGAGIVPWGGDESARFTARTGKKSVDTQALDYLVRHDAITPEERGRISTTNLRRLLGTPEVRGQVGLVFEDGELKAMAEDKKVVKALRHIVDDLLSGRSVKTIYTQKQRRDYAAKFPAPLIVKRKLKQGRAVNGELGEMPKKARAVRRLKSPVRDHLIPRNCILTVTQDRIRAIESELRNLSLASHPNAVSVLLRVFVELSVDEYISLRSLSPTAYDKLRVKMEAVVADLLSRKKLTIQQAKPVRAAMQAGSYLGPSIDLMHDYMHNQWTFPAPADMRAHWDSLQPFAMAIWSP